jgi:hypothetical protein
MDWVKAFFRQVTARTSLVRPTMCDKGLTLDKNCSKRKSKLEACILIKLLLPIQQLKGSSHYMALDGKLKRKLFVY